MSSGEWVIAGKEKGAAPEVGKTYEVRHSRKGTFGLKITAVRGEWLDGEVTSGVAKAVMTYNVGEVGDSITIRDTHSYLIETSP